MVYVPGRCRGTANLVVEDFLARLTRADGFDVFFFGNRSGSEFLALPPPVRQFLISPPASPPVGWAPAPESEPVVDFDLLTALAQLGPGGRHELLPPAQDRPAIVVHVCEEPDAAAGGAAVARNRIVQTRCPNRCD